MALVKQGLLVPSGPSPALAGPPRAGCLGLLPGGFWRPPRRTPYSLWAACASAVTCTTQQCSWCSEGPFCAPVCASCPGTGHHREEDLGPIQFAAFLQVFVDMGEISADPLLFQAEQPQICQPLLIEEMLQLLHILRAFI